MNRRSHRPAMRVAVLSSAIATVVLATTAHAADLYWQGGAGDLASANYFDATNTLSNVAPTSADVVFVGADGTTTYSTAATLALGKLRLGDLSTAGGTAAPAGTGSLAISAGTVTAGGTTGGGINSGLLVGYNNSGSLTLSGTGQLTSAFFGKVGYADDPNATGTGSVTISDTARLTISNRGLQIGEGLPGSVTITGTGSLRVNNGTTGQLAVGTTTTGTFLQTGGSTVTGNNIFVGRDSGANSSMTVSGGTVTVNGGFFVGDGTATDSSATFTGSATGTINGNVNVGQSATTARSTLTINGSANFTTGTSTNTTTGVVTGFGIAVANAAATDSSLVIGGSAHLTTGAGTNTTTGVITAGTLTVGAANALRSSVTIKDSAVVSVGTITVGNGAGATDSSLLVTDNATLNSTGGLTVAGNSTVNSAATVNGNATVNLVGSLTLGNGADPNAVLNVGGTSTINIGVQSANPTVAPSITAHLFVGRSTSTSTFNMAGGTINAPNLALFGTASVGAVATVNHSAGTINSGTSATSANRGFTVGDTNGAVNYNLSGTGVVNSVNGPMIVGRRSPATTFNQTGGAVTASGGLRIGYGASDVVTDQTGTGTYALSGGSLTASLASGNALSIGEQGTGTLRVIGDDATINVTGNVLVNSLPAVDATPARVGTLAYQLEAGDSGLSTVAATGTATFNAGSVLQLDFNAIKPVQGVYNVLTASDVINSGLVPSIPAGWNYQVVPSTGGKTLRFIAGDFNADALINADDFAWMDRGRAMGLTGGANGDLNADGTINSEDYQLIDQAFGATNTLSPGFLAARASEFGDAYVSQLVAAVPEPGSLAALGLALPALMRRRRNR